MARLLASGICLLTLVIATPASARDYNPDPFGDKDFDTRPILLNKTRSTSGRLELGALFGMSVVEKYTRHIGGAVALDYHLTDYLAMELYGGYWGSNYTAIVTSEGGIVGNINASGQQRDPNIPDRTMMTYFADAVLIFSPIYGKINLVSELDFSTNIYLLAGVGINGARNLAYDYAGSQAALTAQFTSESAGISPNVVWGVGIKLFLTDWMALRLEFRDIDYLDEFDFNEDGTQQTYVTMNHMFNAGLSFFPF